LPITENEETVCLSARSFLPFIKPPYLFPHYGETVCTAGEVVWGYDFAQIYSKTAVILVEGVFDAIAVNQKMDTGIGIHIYGLALLNKAMTKAQRNKLLRLDKKVRFYIMLDADARKDSLKIARELSNYGRRVYLCFLPEGDPASVSQEQYDKTFEGAKEFDDELEMEEAF
jgi:DNA primase